MLFRSLFIILTAVTISFGSPFIMSCAAGNDKPAPPPKTTPKPPKPCPWEKGVDDKGKPTKTVPCKPDPSGDKLKDQF